MFAKLSSFLQESKQELMRVNWPSREDTTRLTLSVVLISLLAAFFLGAMDFIFSSLLNTFFLR